MITEHKNLEDMIKFKLHLKATMSDRRLLAFKANTEAGVGTTADGKVRCPEPECVGCIEMKNKPQVNDIPTNKTQRLVNREGYVKAIWDCHSFHVIEESWIISSCKLSWL